MDKATLAYLEQNADPNARLCHCGCGNYVEQPESGGTTRFHFSDECAARCIARREEAK